MRHKKLVHSDNVQLCIKFSGGECTFGDSCWFNHDPSIGKPIYEYTCNFCEEKFAFKSTFMRHRKTKHSMLVPMCNKETCQYKSKTCWFNHNNSENINDNEVVDDVHENENETNKIIQKLVKMVEKYSERIRILENMMVK